MARLVDRNLLLTGAGAAAHIGTYPQRIYTWVNRDKVLAPATGADVPADGRKYYRLGDVLDAEKATRKTVKRRGGRRRIGVQPVPGEQESAA